MGKIQLWNSLSFFRSLFKLTARNNATLCLGQETKNNFSNKSDSTYLLIVLHELRFYHLIMKLKLPFLVVVEIKAMNSYHFNNRGFSMQHFPLDDVSPSKLSMFGDKLWTSADSFKSTVKLIILSCINLIK